MKIYEMKNVENVKTIQLERWSEINGKLIEMQDKDDFYVLIKKYEIICKLNILKEKCNKNINIKDYINKEVSIIKTDKGHRIKLIQDIQKTNKCQRELKKSCYDSH